MSWGGREREGGREVMLIEVITVKFSIYSLIDKCSSFFSVFPGKTEQKTWRQNKVRMPGMSCYLSSIDLCRGGGNLIPGPGRSQ